ncbi:response regulator transcription factor [Nocardia halotolerans]|uniref:Response regulator transcription factor n=1 Tax=Nocardia halotolerans TaxID=1755878 RepID=A0ABV8VJ19_9NOCA
MESNARERESLSRKLQRHGYPVTAVDTGAGALRRHYEAALILLNVDLSDLDGIEICRTVRDSSAVPIIIVTARASELDRILGLRSGADDYIVHPYGTRELIARIQAVTRRCRTSQHNSASAGSDLLRYDQLTINSRTRRVELSGTPLKMTRKEFDLLLLLAANPDTVIDRHTIADQIWDGSLSSRTVDTHVNNLRKKLNCNDWIITVRGVGFRFATDVGCGIEDDNLSA